MSQILSGFCFVNDCLYSYQKLIWRELDCNQCQCQTHILLLNSQMPQQKSRESVWLDHMGSAISVLRRTIPGRRIRDKSCRMPPSKASCRSRLHPDTALPSKISLFKSKLLQHQILSKLPSHRIQSWLSKAPAALQRAHVFLLVLETGTDLDSMSSEITKPGNISLSFQR